MDDERNTDGLTTFGGAIMHARTLVRKRATYRDGRQIKQEGEQFSPVIPHFSSDPTVLIAQYSTEMPLLFVWAADFLQTLLNAACSVGDLSLRLPLPNDQDFPILWYADDTLIFLHGEVEQLIFLKNLLNLFGESTGLKVNFHKSFMVPINVQEDKISPPGYHFWVLQGLLTFYIYGPSFTLVLLLL